MTLHRSRGAICGVPGRPSDRGSMRVLFVREGGGTQRQSIPKSRIPDRSPRLRAPSRRRIGQGGWARRTVDATVPAVPAQ